MKKVLSLLLVVSLLMGVCSSALAEVAYEVIKGALNESLETGVSVPVDSTPDEKAVVLLFSPIDEEVFLWGRNDKGELEATIWEVENSLHCIALFAVYCNLYETVAGVTSPGVGYTIILELTEEGDEEPNFFTVDNAADAAEAAQIFMDVMGIDLNN